MRGWVGVFWPGPPSPPTHWSVDAEFFSTVTEAEVSLAYRVRGVRSSRPPRKVVWRDGLPAVVEVTRPWLFDEVNPDEAQILLHKIDRLTYDRVKAEPFGELIVYMEDGAPTARPATQDDA